MAASDDRAKRVVVRGAAKTVEYAVDANGAMPAKEFLDSGFADGSLNKAELAGIRRLFEKMAAHGRITSKQKFRKERGEIYAFKRGQIRVPAFCIGNTWYLTHGFKKKKDKWLDTELDRADRIRHEHLNRKGDSP
jgi:hypothetical protein